MAIPALTLRKVKGSALTFDEADKNFENLANAVVQVSAGGTTSNVALNGTLSIANSASVTATVTGGTVTLNAVAPSAFSANVNGNGFYLENVIFNNYREKVANIGTITGTVTLNGNTATIQTAAVSGNITINSNNLTNLPAGESVSLILRHTANTRSFSSNIKFVNGNKTIGGTTNVTDVITFFYDGTEYLGSVAKYQA